MLLPLGLQVEGADDMAGLMLAAAVAALTVAYVFGLAIYRLYLSPLAKFPGPKLAALTSWYEAYYEIVLNGQFTFHIEELHRKYGKQDSHTPGDRLLLSIEIRPNRSYQARRSPYKRSLILGDPLRKAYKVL